MTPVAVADVTARARELEGQRAALDRRIGELRASLGEQRSAFIDARVDEQLRGNGAAARAAALSQTVATLARDLDEAERDRDVVIRLEADLAAQLADAQRAELGKRKAALRAKFVVQRALRLLAIRELLRAAAAEDEFADECTRAGFDAIGEVMGARITTSRRDPRTFGPASDPMGDLVSGLAAGGVDLLGFTPTEIRDVDDQRVTDRLRKLASGGKR